MVVFTPHFGGAVATAAVIAARAGARIGLAGGAGEDPWGRWLAARLALSGFYVSSVAAALPEAMSAAADACQRWGALD